MPLAAKTNFKKKLYYTNILIHILTKHNSNVKWGHMCTLTNSHMTIPNMLNACYLMSWCPVKGKSV